MVAAFFTVGEIARLAGVPVHRVQYAIRTQRLDPIGTAGGANIYDPAMADELVASLKRAAEAKPQIGPRAGQSERPAASAATA